MFKRGGSFVSLSSPVLRNSDQFGLLPGTLKSMSTLLQHNSIGGYKSKWAFFQPDNRALDILRQLVDDKVLIPYMSKTYSFCELPYAYADTAGKNVIDFNANKTN